MRGKKNCLDCLHCKVSAQSTAKCRLCFCEEKEKKVRHKEFYWLNKKPCDEFSDMTETVKLAVLQKPINKRRKPLLRNNAYGPA